MCGSVLSTAVVRQPRHGLGIDPERHHVQHARHLLDGRQEGAERRAHELRRGAVLAHQHVGDHRRFVDVDRTRAGHRAARELDAGERRVHAAPCLAQRDADLEFHGDEGLARRR